MITHYYGSYYFLSEKRGEHTRITFSYINLISEVGGLGVAILTFIGFITSRITYCHIVARFVREIYTPKKEGKTVNKISGKGSINMEVIKSKFKTVEILY